MARFVTSDLHFNHEGIINLCKRPFKNLPEMHKTLIDNWNSIVKNEDDVVYVLGDFMLGKDVEKCANFLKKLCGRKILIWGNHDTMTHLQYLEAGFSVVTTSVEIRLLECVNVFAVHDPAVVVASPYDYNLVGHIHTLYKVLKADTGHFLFNVGVDKNDFKPINLDELNLYRLEEG